MPKFKRLRQRLLEVMGQCHANNASISTVEGPPLPLPRRNSFSSADSRKAKSKKKLQSFNHGVSGSNHSKNAANPYTLSIHSQADAISGDDSAAAGTSPQEISPQQLSSILEGCIDSADIVIAIEERVEYMINHLSPAEILQIQRKLRKITRSIRKKEGTGVGRTAMMVNSSKSALSRSCLDDYIFKRIFAGGHENIATGLDAWHRLKKRHWGAQQQQLQQQSSNKGANLLLSQHAESKMTELDMIGVGSNTIDRTTNGTDSNIIAEREANTIANENGTTSEANNDMKPLATGGDDMDSQSSSSQLSRSMHSSGNNLAALSAKEVSSMKPPTSPTRPYIITSTLSSSSIHLPGGGKSPKVDPLMSLYLILLYASEYRWDAFAAQASVSATMCSPDAATSNEVPTTNPLNSPSNGTSRKKSIMTAFLNGANNNCGNFNEADDVSMVSTTIQGSLSTPPGITFFMLSYVISVALRGNRRQKLLILFHACIPPKQMKSVMQQQNSSFPSYLFELGFENFDNSMLSVESPSRNYDLCGLEVPRTQAADIIASLLLASGDFHASQQAIMSQSNGDSYQNPVPSTPHLLKLYNACFAEPKSLKFAEFIKWSTDDIGITDAVLDQILSSMLLDDIIVSPEAERQLIKDLWSEWQGEELLKLPAMAPSHANSSDVDDSEDADVFDNNINSEMPIRPSHAKKRSGLWGFVSNRGDNQNGNIPSLPTLSSGKQTTWKRVFGGIGNFDGLGGLGNGVLYCVDKSWWDKWTAYVKPIEEDETQPNRIRPPPMSTEKLLHKASYGECGTLGSYEKMKSNLKQNEDYVLIPPPVWDALFEIYGGGPPLPRMVEGAWPKNAAKPGKTILNSTIPMFSNVKVVLDPWIITCQICDPLQPYRRGEAGPLTVRVMATPDQPFWRLFSELVVRLPITNPRAKDASGRGIARLWRKVESAITGEDKDLSNASRYGPWLLLCKGRSAEFPVVMLPSQNEVDWATYEKLWLEYTDHSSVESVGLCDGMTLMFEYGIQGKDGNVTWPREAAAKAGRMRRLAEEDAVFRLKLRGLDKDGIPTTQSLEGCSIDAMDSTGRWYRSQIVQVERKRISRKIKEATTLESTDSESEYSEIVRVKIDFCDAQYHEEWIDVDSDRLAVEGRFTLDSMKSLQKMESDGPDVPGNMIMDSRPSGPPLGRKIGSTNDAASLDTGSLCLFPGYGACGLINLGNSCYMSVALQCVSYMPFIRSYLLSGQYRTNGDLNRENPLGTGGRLLEELGELMRQMWSGKYGTRSATRFRSTLAKVRSQFSGTEQQDAQELLNTVFDCLHEDSNKVRKKPIVPPIDDDWAKQKALSRVGLEAWRRFLRRNRSVITNTAMGQVLNRVTCPTCKHSSLNFDPFNMLSLPFPTVAEVWFRCTLVRRGTALNCPNILDRRIKENDLNTSTSVPSESSIMETYVLSVSRLADIGDLKLRLEEASGISAEKLRLCKFELVPVPLSFRGKIPESNRYMKLIPLSDKEGPCVQLTKSPGKDETSDLSITDIVVYESTLNTRAVEVIELEELNGKSDDEKTVTSEEGETDTYEIGYLRTSSSQSRIKTELRYYGSDDECVTVDTDPSFLARSVSRSLWPMKAADFRLGLRVDAMDQRDHWFPGSIVEISDFNAKEEGKKGKEIDEASSRRVRVHFDNFSARWDEWYDYDDFKNGHVRPLYSHSTPKFKPTEVLVHHRIGSSCKKSSPTSGDFSCALFGQPFYLQFFNEWSTARAGAHVLAQAARFLQSNVPSSFPTPGGSIESDRLEEAIETACSAIAEAVDVLVSSERSYIQHALAVQDNGEMVTGDRKRYFDAAAMTSALSDKLGSLLPRLPFDVRVCSSESITIEGMRGDHEESSFPFSLVRTVGNYLHSKNAIILHWRNVKLEKRSKRAQNSSGSAGSESGAISIVYRDPDVREHADNSKFINKADNLKLAKHDGEPDLAAGSMDIGVCLTEFCKEQKLSIDDCWMCPKCKELRAGVQSMSLWRLPDIVTFHIKRFNCSARWREKISTKINFPLTGLDLAPWCDNDSVALEDKLSKSGESTTYDLIGVVNHLGGMTGGHYVSACKATACGPDGCEELAHTFNGQGCNSDFSNSEGDDQGNLWKLPGRGINKDGSHSAHPFKSYTQYSGKAVSDSCEPLWLQFDDDLVEPIPPKSVVSEMAYVLFYRRRHLTTSNIARYSTLE